MIIEMFGLPGCGKSTITKELTRVLRNKGFEVKTYNDFKQFGSLRSLCIHALEVKEIRLFLRNTFLFCLTNGLLFKSDIFKRIVSCIAFLYFYKTFDKPKQCIVMDEGVIQGIISAIYIYDHYRVKFKKIIQSIPRDIFFVYLITDPMVSSDRIVERKTFGHGRCDDIDNPKELLMILNHQKTNFDTIYKELSADHKTMSCNNEYSIFEVVDDIVIKYSL